MLSAMQPGCIATMGCHRRATNCARPRPERCRGETYRKERFQRSSCRFFDLTRQGLASYDLAGNCCRAVTWWRRKWQTRWLRSARATEALGEPRANPATPFFTYRTGCVRLADLHVDEPADGGTHCVCARAHYARACCACAHACCASACASTCCARTHCAHCARAHCARTHCARACCACACAHHAHCACAHYAHCACAHCARACCARAHCAHS